MNGPEKKIMKKGKCCVYCKCEEPLVLTIDHKLPKVRGGLDNKENLQVCCFFCNQLKGALSHQEFLIYRKALHAMHELEKVKVQFPNQLPVVFKPYYYPDYQPSQQQLLKNDTRPSGQTPP